MPAFFRFVLLLWLPVTFVAETSAQTQPPTRPVPTRPAPQPVRKPARPPRPWFVSFAAGYPTGLPKFDNTVAITEFVETGSRKVGYTTPGAPAVDVGIGVQVRRGLFLGGAVSAFNASTEGELTAEIPHPFFFDQKRTLTASVDGLERQELGIHIQAATIVPLNRRMRIFLAGGPSLFRVRQELVSNVSYSQEYPFDVVTFTGATRESQAKTGLGFHGQGGLVAMFSRRVGADVLVRYSSASVQFESSDGSTFSASFGGLQVATGIRAIF